MWLNFLIRDLTLAPMLSYLYNSFCSCFHSRPAMPSKMTFDYYPSLMVNPFPPVQAESKQMKTDDFSIFSPPKIYKPFAFASKTLTASGPLFGAPFGLGIARSLSVLVGGFLGLPSVTMESWLKVRPLPLRSRGVVGLEAMNYVTFSFYTSRKNGRTNIASSA